MTLHPSLYTTQVRPRPEGGGDFAPALGDGSGANRFASEPGRGVATRVPDPIRDLLPLKQRPRRGGRGATGAGRGFAGRRTPRVPDLLRDLAPTDRRLAQGGGAL